jgi:hypothetical protein
MNQLYPVPQAVQGSEGRSTDLNFRLQLQIDAGLYDAAIELIEDTGRWEVHQALRWKIARNWQIHRPHDFGLTIFFCQEAGDYWQAKPQYPTTDRDGKVAKYQAIAGNGSRAFLPPIPWETWKKICKRYQIRIEEIWLRALDKGLTTISTIEKLSTSSQQTSFQSSTDLGAQDESFRWMGQTSGDIQGKSSQGFGKDSHKNDWRSSKDDLAKALRCLVDDLPPATIVPDFWGWVAESDIDLILTEGGKKSLAALNLGYIGISLYGVNAGVSKHTTIGGERLRKANPELIPDLQRFAQPGRQWTIAFDQDSKATTRTKVANAIADLSWHLEQSGGTVRIATWEAQGGTAKGLDDLIFNTGADNWHTAYKAAIPANQYRIQLELSRAVRRRPDLHIGDREFAEVIDQLPKSGLIVLHGGKGSGKSKAIGAMLAGRRWLSSTPLISLGRDQAASWGGAFINDGDIMGDRLLKDGRPVDGAAVCIPSLLKVQRIKHDVLVVDETTAHLEFLLNSPLANKQGMRPLLLAEHQRQAQFADLVILADADATEESIAHYENITGHRAFLVRSDRQNLRYPAHILDGKQAAAIAAMTQRLEVAEGLLYVNTDSKTLADAISRMLTEAGHKSLLVTSDTSGGDEQAQFLSSKGAMIPQLLAQGVRAIVSSPTIAQGFSIELHTNQIDSVWGFYKGGSITAHGIAQSLDRVRADVPRFVHISKKGGAYSRLSKAQSVAAFTREFRQLSTASARLARLSLTPEAIATSDGIDWQGSNIKMLAALEVRRNRGMGALRDTVIALLKQEGKQVQIHKPAISAAEARSASQAIKQAAQAIAQAQAEAIAQSETLTEAAAEKLTNQTDPLTPDEVLALAKYRLGQFYRIEVDTDLVVFDKSGRTQQQIRALERVLNPQLAIDRTAGSINHNPENPQDWSRAAARSWLHQQAGFAEFVGAIVDGQIVKIEPEHLTPIADFARQHPTEYRVAFGYKSIGDMPDQQLVGLMLESVGIRTRRKRRGSIYSIDTEALAGLLAVMRRREKVDPQRLKLIVNPPSGSPENPPTSGSGSPQIEPQTDPSIDPYGFTIDQWKQAA